MRTVKVLRRLLRSISSSEYLQVTISYFAESQVIRLLIVRKAIYDYLFDLTRYVQVSIFQPYRDGRTDGQKDR